MSSTPATTASTNTPPASTASGSTGDLKKDQSSEQNIRESNIVAGRAIADTLRTSLGPRGMDKMITSPSGDVTITNDGATILEQLQLQHPAAKIVCCVISRHITSFFVFVLIIIYICNVLCIDG